MSLQLIEGYDTTDIENTEMNTEFYTYMRSLPVLYIGSDTDSCKECINLLSNYFDHITTAQGREEGLSIYEAHHENHKHYGIVFIYFDTQQMYEVDLVEQLYTLNEKQNIVVFLKHEALSHIIPLMSTGVTNFVLHPGEKAQFEKIVYPIVSTCKTLDEITHMQEKINSVESELQNITESSQQKSSFLATMSHEVRTPLNAIVGFVSLLHENEQDTKKKRHLSIIKDASDSLLKVVSDILDIIKIENDKLEIENIVFDLYDELEQINVQFKRKAENKGLRFKFLYPSSMPKELKGDFHKTKQVITNLLTNAIRFTKEKSTVKCSIWYKEGRLYARIKDYGIGIVEEKHKYIFEAFRQADNVMAKEYGDTGLNLALSAELIKILQGNIHFESHRGGSIFQISVPMGQVSQTSHIKIKNIQSGDHALEGHLLIVDDIEANLMFLSVLLDNLKLTYDTAVDGLDALEKYKRYNYDMILMDEKMPRMNGTEAIKAIRNVEQNEGRAHIPIVSLSADDLLMDKKCFTDLGIDGVLRKPLHPQDLSNELSRLL